MRCSRGVTAPPSRRPVTASCAAWAQATADFRARTSKRSTRYAAVVRQPPRGDSTSSARPGSLPRRLRRPAVRPAHHRATQSPRPGRRRGARGRTRRPWCPRCLGSSARASSPRTGRARRRSPRRARADPSRPRPGGDGEPVDEAEDAGEKTTNDSGADHVPSRDRECGPVRDEVQDVEDHGCDQQAEGKHDEYRMNCMTQRFRRTGHRTPTFVYGRRPACRRRWNSGTPVAPRSCADDSAWAAAALRIDSAFAQPSSSTVVRQNG